MQLLSRWSLGAALTGAALGVFVACADNPGIDGAAVPTLGSELAPPACEPMCERLGHLCGYAPTGCVELCADYDDAHRACIGQAASCQAALETCATEEVDAGEEAAADEDATPPGDDAGEDAATEDGSPSGAEGGADAADAAVDG